MSEPKREDGYQEELFPDNVAQERTLLDDLLRQSRLYHQSREYLDLLDFTIRLRNMAPFNAMLLQIQCGLGRVPFVPHRDSICTLYVLVKRQLTMRFSGRGQRVSGSLSALQARVSPARPLSAGVRL